MPSTASLIPKFLIILVKLMTYTIFIRCIYMIWNFLKNDPNMRQNEKMMCLLGVMVMIALFTQLGFVLNVTLSQESPKNKENVFHVQKYLPIIQNFLNS